MQRRARSKVDPILFLLPSEVLTGRHQACGVGVLTKHPGAGTEISVLIDHLSWFPLCKALTHSPLICFYEGALLLWIALNLIIFDVNSILL